MKKVLWGAVLALLALWLSVPAMADNYVAQIGEVKYASVENAFSAATSGDTIQLIADVVMRERLDVENKSITLDLNDHGLSINYSVVGHKVFWIKNGHLTLTDNAETQNVHSIEMAQCGELTLGENRPPVRGRFPASGAAGKTITVTGGYIAGGYANGVGGGGVFVDEGGSLTMNGGTICACTTSVKDSGGGVYVWRGSFTMNGGAIRNNNSYGNGGGVFVDAGGTFTMNDGTISGNTASIHGGGVFVNANASFDMTGGSIEKNTAKDSGGGVYSTGTFTMTGGVIGGSGTEQNTAVSGGGVCVAGGTFTMGDNAAIRGNYAWSLGGGVCVAAGATLSQTGGSITGNSAPNWGGGVFIWGGGTLEMSGGDISGNTTTGNGGGVTVWGNGTFQVSGKACVTGNLQGEAEGDVYLANGTFVTVSGKLEDGARIGVAMESPGVFTNTADGNKDYNDTSKFRSTSSEYAVGKKAESDADAGQLYLGNAVSSKATVTFKVECGSWKDGTKKAKTVTLTSLENEALHLAAPDIPAIGKPDDGYGEGAWDATPNTTTGITQNTTYTYTFKKKASVTTPPAAQTLTYTGSDQDLVSGGSATDGTLVYVLGTNATTAPTSGWSENVPKGCDAKDYCVWYMASGDVDRISTAPASLDVTIKQRPVTVTAKDQTVVRGGKIAMGPDWADLSGQVDGHKLSVVTLTASSAANVTNNGTITPSSVTIVDGNNKPVTGNYKITCKDGTLTVKNVNITPDTLSGTVGEPGTWTLTANPEDYAPYTWTVTDLPRGLSGSETDDGKTYTITGTPLQDGTSNVTVTVTPTGGTEEEQVIPFTVSRKDGEDTDYGTKSDPKTTNDGSGSHTETQTVFKESWAGGVIIASVDITITTESKDLRGTVSEDFSSIVGVSVDVSINKQYYGHDCYTLSLDVTGLPEGLTAEGKMLFEDIPLASHDFTLTLSGTPTAVASGDLKIAATVTVSGDLPVLVASADKTVTLTVKKATPDYTVPTGLTATYGQTLEVVTLLDGWAWNEPTTSVGDVGSHDFPATFTPADTENYNTVTKDVTVKVEKADASVTKAPTARTGLTYNTRAQELVTAGEADGGTMVYKLKDGVYSTDIPMGTNADTYTVYYMVSGDVNHKDTTEQTVNVTISPKPEEKTAVTSVTLDRTSLTLKEGKTLTLIATVLPDNATDKTVTWTTSNPGIATVENGKVTAIAEGTATITATTVDGGKTATCMVTVIAKNTVIIGDDTTADVTSISELLSNLDNPAEITSIVIQDASSLESRLEGIEKLTSLKTLTIENVDDLTDISNVKNLPQLTKLVVKDCSTLENVDLSGSKLTEVTMSDCDSLTSLDLRGSEELISLDVHNGSLGMLNAGGCIKLTWLNCASNDLEALALDDCTELSWLNCASNDLNALNLDDCTSLSWLNCSYNHLPALNMGLFRLLRGLLCNGQTLFGLINEPSAGKYVLFIGVFLDEGSVRVAADTTTEVDLAKVRNVKAYDESGVEITGVTYDSETGTVTFPREPAKVTYDYPTGYSENGNEVLMDVTLTGGSEPDYDAPTSDKGSGGGCDAGLGLAGLLAIMPLLPRRRKK